jgi:hypothetical protein
MFMDWKSQCNHNKNSRFPFHFFCGTCQADSKIHMEMQEAKNIQDIFKDREQGGRTCFPKYQDLIVRYSD